MNALQTLSELVDIQIDTLEWLERCPQPKADAFFSVAGTIAEQQQEQIVQLALSVGDEALTETIRGFVDEGELPMLPDGEDMDEVEFWRVVSEMIQQIKIRK